MNFNFRPALSVKPNVREKTLEAIDVLLERHPGFKGDRYANMSAFLGSIRRKNPELARDMISYIKENVNDISYATEVSPQRIMSMITDLSGKAA